MFRKSGNKRGVRWAYADWKENWENDGIKPAKTRAKEWRKAILPLLAE
jgi:hypothetical protein